jgi:RNA-directed DNA polymerase
MEHWRPTAGTPQGAVISPLLANIYLHPLDRLMAESGYRMVRYADDFVILCRTAQEAEAALRRAMAWVADNGLRLHPDKTRIGDCRQPGQGFDFLGYRFEAGRRLVPQKSLCAFKSLPSAKAGDKVRAMTGRSRGASMRRIIDDLNPMLRGWFGYFKQAAPSIHRHLDGFIQRWPNTFFADLGLFTLSTARYHARHPR